ncbi:MAG: right-handed parallel beta-helix repeat-containing protein [Candidatus Woesebacteria bacterium]|jgi:parallel beta-helix repeat protein
MTEADNLIKTSFLKKIVAFCFFSLISLLVFSLAQILLDKNPSFTGYDDNSQVLRSAENLKQSNRAKVLAAADERTDRQSLMTFNIETVFKKLLKVAGLKVEEEAEFAGTSTFNAASEFNDSVTFNGDVNLAENVTVSGPLTLLNDITGKNISLDLGTTGKLTASNVIYSLTAGDGISITSGQTPTITNDDPGSDQLIFSTIEVDGSGVTAGSNTDTLKFISGSGISLSRSGKEITISGTGIGWTTSGDYVILSDSTDTVGIGTATPNAKLEINSGSDDTSGLRFTQLTGGSTSISNPSGGKVLTVDAGGNVILVDDQTGGSQTAEEILPSASQGGTLYYNGSNWASSTNLYHYGGNVGIYETGPQGRLHVTTNYNVIGLVVERESGQTSNLTEWVDANFTAGDTPLSYIDTSGNFHGDVVGDVTGSINPSLTTGQLAFQGASGLSGDDGLFWDNTGKNLGIGTTDPGSKLQVAGNITPTVTDYDLGTSSLRWDLYANTINADNTITLTGLGIGTDNTVLILDSSNQVTTDEIDSRVWGSSLIDGSGTQNYLTKWSDSDSLTDSLVFDNGSSVGIGTSAVDHLLNVGGNMGLFADAYINWGSTDGSDGYGLRDNSGVIEYKNSTGDWATFASLSNDSYASHHDRVVDPSGGGTDTTIADAISNASAGDVIFIVPGTYSLSSNLSIDKSLTLLGAGRDATIVNGVDGSEATISIVDGVSDVQIKNMSITNAGSGSTDHVIQKLDNTAGGTGENYLFENLEISGGYRGIYMEDGDQTSIINCYIHDTGNIGVQVDSSNDLLVSDSVFESTGNSSVYLQSSWRAKITGNYIEEAGDDGIYLYGAYYSTVSNNTLFEVADVAIAAREADYSTITANVIQGNKSTDKTNMGIYLRQVDHLVISNNSMYRINGDGIDTYASVAITDVAITGNAIYDSEGYGMDLSLSAAGGNFTVTGNSLNDNDSYGIHLNNEFKNSLVANNIFTSNASGDILDDGGSGNIIGPNKVQSATNVMTLDNFTVTTAGQAAAVDGMVTKVVAGACSDAQFTADTNGLLCIDSTNGRIYFRYGDAWHYTDETAGFQIPDHETYSYDFENKRFDESSPMVEGDFLLPFVERYMEDGAVHALHTKFSDVKEIILSDLYEQVAGHEIEIQSLGEIADDKETLAALQLSLENFETRVLGLEDSLAAIETELEEATVDQKMVEQAILSDYLSKAELSSFAKLSYQLWTFVAEVTFKAKASFQGTAEFLAETIFHAETKFKDKAQFEAELVVDESTAGLVILKKGETEVAVNFTREYTNQPIITLTARGEAALKDNLSYTVMNESKTGFNIKINHAQDQDLEFAWHALAVEKTEADLEAALNNAGETDAAQPENSVDTDETPEISPTEAANSAATESAVVDMSEPTAAEEDGESNSETGSNTSEGEDANLLIQGQDKF